MIRWRLNRALAFGAVLASIASCSSEMNYDQMIRDQITNFYSDRDVRGYKPISYSEFDTLQTIDPTDGSAKKIIGIVAHVYQGLNDNGDTTRFEDTFDVTIYKDVVVAIPRGY